jgi:hypothetical protein
MLRKYKLMLWIIGIPFVLIVSAYAWRFFGTSVSSHLCKNDVIETKLSPEGQKKVVIHVRDCGATSDWTTEASLLNATDSISDGDTGNILRINSDQGKASPMAPGGWPIISAEWDSSNSLILHYSQGSGVLYKQDKVRDVNMQFVLITSN